MAPIKILSRAVVIGVGLWLAAPAESASACGGLPCKPDFFLPFEGNLPADTFGVRWWPGQREGVGGDVVHETIPSELTFRCTDAQQVTRDVPFTADVLDTARGRMGLITPNQGLVIGEHCEIAVSLGPCGTDDLGPDVTHAHLLERSTFTVTDAVDQPTALGTLAAEMASVQTTTLATSSGSCTVQVPVCGVAIKVELDPSIVPWSDSLLFTTYVDGERWAVSGSLNTADPTGGSFVGRGKDLVFIANDETEGAGLIVGGVHTIEMRANLVGTDTDVGLATEPFDVVLDCRAPKKHDDGCTVSGHSPRSLSTIMTLCFVIALLAVRRIRTTRAVLRRSRS